MVIIALMAGIFFGFLFMNVIGKLQDSLNPMLTSDEWATEAHYDAFYYAATFVTNMWQYIIPLIIFVVAFWVYIYQQRRGAGYT